MIAPSFIASMWWRSMTLMSPVSVTEDVADGRGLGQRHHAEAVHDRLQRAQRLHLGHDDLRAHPSRPHGDAAAAPAVAADDEVLARPEDVRGAGHAVDRALAGAVAVVEQVLGVGLVDGDDRVSEGAVAGHALQADDAGRRLLGAADDVRDEVAALAVDRRDQVGAVVHRHLRRRAPAPDGCDGSRSRRPRPSSRRSGCRTRRRARPRRRPACSSGLLAQRASWAPPSLRASMRFAVSVVTWRQAESRRFCSGLSFANRSRMRPITGISRAAHSMRRTPSSARLRSFTSWGILGGPFIPCICSFVSITRAWRANGPAHGRSCGHASARQAVAPGSSARSVSRRVTAVSMSRQSSRSRAECRLVPPARFRGRPSSTTSSQVSRRSAVTALVA